MAVPQLIYRGCLLGLAVGDAMGYTVDNRSLEQIREDYGPNGLLGYDLMNGYAEVTSYTQLTAFTCTGLLLGLTRGQLLGRMAPFIRYVALACREWAAGQRPWGRPERIHCWVMHSEELCRRHCMDTWMLETLSRNSLGTPEEPANNYTNCGSITTAIGVGLFLDPDEVSSSEILRLGAETVALIHGSPIAFLSGATLAHIICHSLRSREKSLREIVQQAKDAMLDEYGTAYGQADEVAAWVKMALQLAGDNSITPIQAMERLRCENAAQVLAGGIYAAISCEHDFDAAMIAAVNHSGRSAAVGAITGAILGARMGEAALPEFYLESLECLEPLRELADDLYQGYPMIVGGKLFDGDWERKYLHGGI